MSVKISHQYLYITVMCVCCYQVTNIWSLCNYSSTDHWKRNNYSIVWHTKLLNHVLLILIHSSWSLSTMSNCTKDSHYNIHVLRVFYFTAATVDVSKEEWMHGTPSSPSSNNSCSSHLDDRPSIPNLSRRRMVAGPFQKPL